MNASSPENLYSVKMRSSKWGMHISGAERIVGKNAIPLVASAMAERALGHSKGTPDFINVKIEAASAPLILKALPVTTRTVASPEEGWATVRELLAEDGFARVGEILDLFKETYGMRGAMLVDADTLERLEPDQTRGVRATFMDSAAGGEDIVSAGKNHYAEAIVLATKVAHAPGIVGEICMSDDPGYVTGYVASRRIGYVRVTRLKEEGDPSGGRIFLYRGAREKVQETIDFIQGRCVLVTDVPPKPIPANAQTVRISPAEGIAEELEAVKKEGLWRTVNVRPEGLKNFAGNDYLGLAGHPRLKKAAIEATEKYGAGSGASRLVTGTLEPHAKLEKHLARFKGTEDAVVWSSGYMANTGTISAFLRKGDAVFSDELNHASIVDGCRLSKADVFVYRHNDMEDLERKIVMAGSRRRSIAVSDAVFSMDGDILDLPRFLETCRKHGVLSMIDEAHSTGVMGDTGRGLCEHFGTEHPDILMGTLSKAIGCEGGYVCASRLLCDYLRNKSRSFIFSTAGNPASAAAADEALSAIEENPGLARNVRENAQKLVRMLFDRGISSGTESAIIPVVIGDEKHAMQVSAKLRELGFMVPAIRYPTVARGSARLRVAVSAASKEEDLAELAKAIALACASAEQAD